MSTDYYLVCHECRQRIHIAQDGFSGWTFYSGEKDCMRKLSEWLESHTEGRHDHRFVLHSENVQSSADYAEIEWAPGWMAERRP